MESFLGLLQDDVLERQARTSREGRAGAIISWIEASYQ